MIQSMTGYGKSVIQLPSKKISIEIKSLNSKNLDLNARMPSMYREKELEIRKLIASKLVRGKIDFSLFVEITGEATSSQINKTVVKAYMNQLKDVVEADDTELLKMAIRLPDAVTTEREEIDENEWQKIAAEIDNSLEKIQNYRLDEGKHLEDDFLIRVKNISALLEQVIAMDPERIESVRERLNRGIAEIKEKVDENRFEQELVYYIEKFDITEEKVRLTNHLDYFQKALNSEDSNGKKLGFISQEIGREINTIGSKSNYAPMQKLVVQMKDELEKIKEQLLNVL
ncbi:YicC/YloC family endoribonuclease [Psychroserpens sp.]|uniref:YicC/YloC family endoribonuclease n=1 Tax=Psychroserpens sp. TaxID=2020870 RepID=UPI001B1F80B7|nr:YicC/YloC family endoribonuclease [Psychroserpens sp.]MBO6605526.1 YicC family protein [Psychroserpens sp.]MBO6630191.1 YicC family protein [Psychroserpens sp.]MBO6653665.1 YicC family protein [Psychroserpens sp.]MBO6681986.1 YicC family protein [Psychroserpens sp.]MBO6748900.1 YicC family protein [Psychroserpens sp.]